MLLFIIGRLGGDKSCMVEDKKRCRYSE